MCRGFALDSVTSLQSAIDFTPSNRCRIEDIRKSYFCINISEMQAVTKLRNYQLIHSGESVKSKDSTSRRKASGDCGPSILDLDWSNDSQKTSPLATPSPTSVQVSEQLI